MPRTHDRRRPSLFCAPTARLIVLAMMITLAPIETARADRDALSTELAFTTERVVVFKDGHALIVKRGVGRTDDRGDVHTFDVPESAVLGTVWAVSDAGQLIGMQSRVVENSQVAESEDTCMTTAEVLRANVGRRMTLELHTNQEFHGVLTRVLDQPAAPPMRNDALPAAPHGDPNMLIGSQVRELAPIGGNLLLFTTEDGQQTLFATSAVRTIRGEQLDVTMTRSTLISTTRKQLTFQFGPEQADRDVVVHMMYFTPGIRWIPTYRLTGDLERTGDLSLQGELLDELEDLNAAAFDLVVGVPNFRFKDAVSPLTLERTLRNALRENAPGLMGQMMSNSFTQRAGEFRGHADGAVDVMDLAPEVTGSEAADLYVYHLGRYALPKGGRATVGLWSEPVEFSHLYTLDIDVSAAASGQPPAHSHRTPDIGDASPQRFSRHRVWHQLEMTNGTSSPWTTGPIMLMQGLVPVAQELLTYTPRGGRALVPLTVAVNVRTSQRETETMRKPNDLKWGHYNYSLIRKSGEVRVTNREAHSITLRLTVAMDGRAEEASGEGRITIDDSNRDNWRSSDDSVNPRSTIEWTLTLDPGESMTTTYERSYYAR